MYRPDANKKSLFTAGRFDYELGNNTGLIYENNFDGAQLKFANDKMAATVGADYTFAKNAQLQVFQTFDSKAKSTHKDRDELTRAQFVFVF